MNFHFEDISLPYKESGVDTRSAQILIKNFLPYAQKTLHKNVISGIGGFSALFDLDFLKKFKNPVLLTSTDGVGTKLCYATYFNRYETIGYDLVAMCANDILVSGGKPFLFLDYLVVDRLNVEKMELVLRSIASACSLIECSILGGETAEHPNSFKNKEDFDLAGFMIGFLEKEEILHSDLIQENDIIIGVPSSGIHSNGISLIRKLFFDPYTSQSNQKEILEFLKYSILLQPTILYEPILRPLLDQKLIHSLVHITGGGFFENIPRILKENFYVELNPWQLKEPFDLIAKKGNLDFIEMVKVFNCGFGMLVFCDQSKENFILNAIQEGIQKYKQNYYQKQKEFFYEFKEYWDDWHLQYINQKPTVIGKVGISKNLSKKVIIKQ